ncbi:Voltage-dependent calcium channel type D subunit alpha-1 [Bienertia sinuspersici]
MGICNSQMAKRNGNFLSWRPTVMIIHLDGRLEEFNQPITVRHVLTQHLDYFIASSESMYVDSIVPPIPNDDELEVGQIYFLLPLCQAHKVFSLQDLCDLAIKASIALGFPKMKRSPSNVAKIVAQARTSCRVLTGFDAISVLNHQTRRSSRKIEL